MNRPMTWTFSERNFLPFLKSASILLLGTGIGILANIYSPTYVAIGTALFTLLCMSLYVLSSRGWATEEHPVMLEKQKNPLLFYLFYLAFFLSITIPKSGRTFANIPITTANIVILCALVFWALRLAFSQETLFSLPLAKPLLVFMLYGCFALMVGLAHENPTKIVILDFVAFIGFIPVYFLVCSVLRKPSQITKIVWTVVIALILVCAYGMLQKRFGPERIAIPGITEQYDLILYAHFGGRWNIIAGGGQKLYSTFQNGNIFGHHLATFLPFIGGFFLGIRSTRKKTVLFGIFLFCCYILILTYSRGALAGTICGFMTLALISKKIRLKAFIAIVAAFFLLLGLLWYYADQPGMERYDVRKVSEDPNSFSAGRLERAQEVLKGFANLPMIDKIFGLGWGGELISPKYWRFLYVDNLYLTFLFKLGIVGTLIFITILTQLLLKLLHYCRSTTDPVIHGLLYGSIAGLVAAMVHNLADALWLFPPLAANFWFLAGISICIGMIAARQESAQQKAETPPFDRLRTPQKTRIRRMR
ncbi:hypothetical protein U27_02684 [Candidatus Vecturithrix granuli]|uniref:O-antigen ligase-related domain-containing protein n=1 Tax=Vecturithrix granuli TaxID=1499967 RepID=A0A081BTS1_VECG1|nr:hypothetical protein U27_02684 [Candidatus Vecturithrix granuli]